MREYWGNPVLVAFFASLLLSLIATVGAVTIGKDAALYLDTARTFTESGMVAAFQQFNWPWFSVLLGVLHQLTHIPLEPLAYGVCALFMAGTCALLVKLAAEKVPGLGWWACLVVLAVPAFNDFRGQILREFGYWFFCILALTVAHAWDEKSTWLRAGFVYASIFLAALFRLEALFLVIAICFWQLTEIRHRSDMGRALQILSLPLFGVMLIGLLSIFTADSIDADRVEKFLVYVHPGAAIQSFQELSSQFADSMKYRYSRDEAGQIVFFGIIATLLLEFFKSLGPFFIPFMTKQLGLRVGHAWGLFKLFGWAYCFYFIVLMVFFWQMQFVNGRYASMLAWLAVPFIAMLALDFSRSHPRLGKVLAVLGVLIVLVNVVSLSPKKTHYKEAARWIADNVEASTQVYFEDSRISYYAGRRVPRQTYSVDMAMGEKAIEFDAFVLEFAADDPVLKEFLGRESLQILTSFENRGGDVVTIVVRQEKIESSK